MWVNCDVGCPGCPNPKPLRTVFVFVFLFILLSLFALPVYAATLWNRSLSRILLEMEGVTTKFRNLVGLSWGTTVLMIIGWTLIPLTKHAAATIPLITGCILEVANVLTLISISKSMYREAMPLKYEWKTLTYTAIPHFILFGIIVIIFFSAIGLCCDAMKAGAYRPREKYIVVFVEVSTSVTRVS